MSDLVEFSTRLPADLHAELKRFAQGHRWSMNTAIIALIEQGLEQERQS